MNRHSYTAFYQSKVCVGTHVGADLYLSSQQVGLISHIAGGSPITHSKCVSHHIQQVGLILHTAGGSHITCCRWVSYHKEQVGLISHTSEKPGLCIQEENMWLKLSTDLLMLILFQQHGRESLQKATEALGLTQSHDALLLQRLAGQGHHSVCVVELCVVVQYHYILDTQQKNHIYIYINLTILWIIVIF